MEKEKIKYFTCYAEIYEWVKVNMPLKTDEKELRTVLLILDLMKEMDVTSIKTALDMLEDAKAILLETVFI